MNIVTIQCTMLQCEFPFFLINICTTEYLNCIIEFCCFYGLFACVADILMYSYISVKYVYFMYQSILES